ncbi:spindlin interactor and repressor of chromatin-binding protein isoform X3 [Sceloporus undulatus]|uniref:spindlin interactor and repressor of chromatin-binding protein isoform X3 n=1 Tax=Sceloporus undulatus TaxID=8520 RepID=UPI001C4DC258|nr:spindlin interactor and repressor of chromatin-binding protein isoform X3 [Sceloporus undulatus]
MALKAETPLLDYIEVSSSVLRYKEKEKADAGAVVPDCTRVKRDGASSNATGKGEQLVPSVVPGSGQEEAGSSWRQEYLIAESHGRPVCMVCGSVLSSSGPAAARKHILQQHAHSLDFNLEEKHNILEAWSEGAVLPTVEPQPSLEGKEWLSECGVPGSAPAEIRIFTDGTFPAGFTLKLYCRTQPEPPQDSGVKTDTRKKKTVDRNCSVSLLRLHSTDSPHHLCSSQGATSRPLTSSAGSNAKDCGTRAGQREASAGKEDAALLAKGFNPIWRARFLMDFDTAAGHLVCMVCEYPLRRVCLATVKRHILQCHAETLNLPREVRRTIREVWESRNQSSPPAPKK